MIATAFPATFVDLATNAPDSTPLAIIVPFPGLLPVAYDALASRLEAGGYNAVLLPLPDDIATLSVHWQNVQAATSTPALWVVHGPAGRWPVPRTACAVAMLGTPFRPRPALWQALPPSADLSNVYPLATERSGYPMSWMVPVLPPWDAALMATEAVSPPTNVPLWLAYAPLDEFAPPESRPPAAENLTVMRFGMLAGWRQDARAVDLLLDPRPADALLRWARPWCDRQLEPRESP